MKVTDGIHWNIYEILPYQRNFNLINGERSLGKTYTTLLFLLDKSINKGLEFVYLVRTQDEKKHGILQSAMAKVIDNHFPECEFVFDTDSCTLDGQVIAHCIAISEVSKVKKRSFPNVKYLIFDEYMLEEVTATAYVKGWKEPDLFLNIYHTIDREQDKVICFLLGNNTKFHNPYHLHPAFKVPKVEKGKIWTSENVLFQNAKGSVERQEQKSECKFLKMINGTQYASYADKGNYMFDNEQFIQPLTGNAHYSFTLIYQSNSYGVFFDKDIFRVFISGKSDTSCKMIVALDINDHNEESSLLNKGSSHLKWLATHYKKGNVRFTSMEIKARCEGALSIII